MTNLNATNTNESNATTTDSNINATTDSNPNIQRDNVVVPRDNVAIQRFTKEERETILTYNEADGYWEIYTGVQSHIRKFDKLNYEVTNVDYYEDGTVAGKFYKVPKKAISFRDPSKKRNLTDEQRLAMAERIKNAREKKNKE